MVEVIKEIVLLLLSLISSIDPYCNNLVKWQILQKYSIVLLKHISMHTLQYAWFQKRYDE